MKIFNNFSKKYFGFTLAEVLITLGIIGVVAAMTLPTLITNYQKKVHASKLIHTYSLINQGFKLYLAKNGGAYISQTDAWAEMPNMSVSSCDPSNWGTAEDCQKLVKQLQAIFTGVSVRNVGVVRYKYLTGNGTGTRGPWAFTMNNGAIFYFGTFKTLNKTGRENQVNSYGTHLSQIVGYLDIDVNGTAGPNQWGRDFFEFQLSDDGILYPEGGRDYSVFRNGNYGLMWNSGNTDWGCDPKTQNNPKGYGCAARILQEGKMNY